MLLVFFSTEIVQKVLSWLKILRTDMGNKNDDVIDQMAPRESTGEGGQPLDVGKGEKRKVNI